MLGIEMKIQKITESDMMDAATLAKRLWPEEDFEELLRDFQHFLTSDIDAVFLARRGKEAVAFAHFALRYDYVEGTTTSPVGYLEGIYVDEDLRKQGIARDLLKKGESWARKKGCAEFASDCVIDNAVSQLFHNSVGFTEAARVICYTKRL